jgi:putative acetyltransferase
MTLILRRMRPGEETRLYAILRTAVIDGAAAHYDEAQRHAWAPPDPFEGWAERLNTAECFVAVLSGRVVGFLSTTAAGHVDLAYVLPDLHGSGVAQRLLARAEAEMRMAGVERMTTGASLAAQRFFARNGWKVLAEETVERGGQRLRRVRMAKDLTVQDSQTS